MMRTSYKLHDLPQAAQKHARTYRLHRFLDAASVGMFSVVIVLLLKDRGFSLFDISILFAVFSGTGLVLEMPLGGLADGIGRKPVFMMSIVAFLLSILTLIMFDDYWLTMLSLVFMGFRMALMSGTLGAWFIERFKTLAPEFSTQPVLAKNQFAGAVGLASSAIIGGLVADFIGPQMVQYGFGVYEVPLFGCLFLGVVVFLYTHFLIQEDDHKVDKAALRSGFSNLGAIIRDSGVYGFRHKVISIMLIGATCSTAAFFSFQSFWILYAEPMLDTQYATSIIGVLSFVYFFSQALGALIAAPVIKIFNGNIAKALSALTMLCMVGLVTVSLTSNIYAFAICLAIFTVLMGSISSPYVSIFNDHIPDDKRSTLLSLDSLMGKLGGLIGLLFIGYISDQYDISAAWRIGAIFILVAGLLYLTLVRRIGNIRNN